MTDALPYGTLCELKSLGVTDTNFHELGNEPISPRAMTFRRPYRKPLSPAPYPPGDMLRPTPKEEFSGSLQDLVEAGLVEFGYLHVDGRPASRFGFKLTDRGFKVVRAVQ